MTSVDQPALEDDVTARLFEVVVQRVRNTAYTPLAVPLACGIVAWQWTLVPVLAVVSVLMGLVGVWQAVTRAVPGGSRWPAAARRLLLDQPWQETPVTVLDTRGTVLALPDGEHVRVHGLTAPAREVVVRAGRVWVVGPDAAGRLAVRVDGLHTPWPARRVRAREAVPARPTTEPIAAVEGRHLVRRARVDLWWATGGGTAFVGLTVLAGVWWFVAASVVAGGVVTAVAVRQLRAVRLRDAGPWQRADATVPSWTSRMSGLADGTIALRFPDGHRYTAHLHGAPLDLFADAWREEALWVAPGGTERAVGFTDYPVVAFARLTPE